MLVEGMDAEWRRQVSYADDRTVLQVVPVSVLDLRVVHRCSS